MKSLSALETHLLGKIMNRRLQFFARRAWPGNHIEIFVHAKTGDGSPAYAQPLQMRVIPKEEEEEGVEQPATFMFTTESAQNLMDELWTIGLRPTEGTGSAGSLAATQKHLDDMRSIVSNQLGVELKK